MYFMLLVYRLLRHAYLLIQCILCSLYRLLRHAYLLIQCILCSLYRLLRHINISTFYQLSLSLCIPALVKYPLHLPVFLLFLLFGPQLLITNDIQAYYLSQFEPLLVLIRICWLKLNVHYLNIVSTAST